MITGCIIMERLIPERSQSAEGDVVGREMRVTLKASLGTTRQQHSVHAQAPAELCYFLFYQNWRVGRCQVCHKHHDGSSWTPLLPAGLEHIPMGAAQGIPHHLKINNNQSAPPPQLLTPGRSF